MKTYTVSASKMDSELNTAENMIQLLKKSIADGTVKKRTRELTILSNCIENMRVALDEDFITSKELDSAIEINTNHEN